MPVWLEITLSIIETVFIVGGAVIAILGLNTWRKEMVGKRKSELAEEVLALFYEARDIFSWARFPGGYSSEGETRPVIEEESTEQAEARKGWYVPAERLIKHTDLFSRLHSLKYRFIAYFGTDASKPFEGIKSIHDKILIATSTLIRTEPENPKKGLPESVQKLRERCEEEIGWFLENDPLEPLISEAITEIESICKPHLTGK